MEKLTEKQPIIGESSALIIPQRRLFLRFAGATALATTLLLTTSCEDDDAMPTDPDAVDLGSGDIGILNYAYALKQLEAAFYAAVVAQSLSMFNPAEQQIMQDLEGHEGIYK